MFGRLIFWYGVNGNGDLCGMRRDPL